MHDFVTILYIYQRQENNIENDALLKALYEPDDEVLKTGVEWWLVLWAARRGGQFGISICSQFLSSRWVQGLNGAESARAAKGECGFSNTDKLEEDMWNLVPETKNSLLTAQLLPSPVAEEDY